MKKIYLIAMLVFLTGCATDPASKGDKTYRSVISAWTQQIGHGTEGKHLLHSLLVDGEKLYATSYREIAVFDRANGKQIWRRKYDSAINTGVVISGEMLIYGGDAELVAISRSTGEQIWRADVSSEILANPVVAGGLVIVRSVDGHLSAHDANSGKQQWSYQFRVPILSLRGYASPTVQGDSVFIGSDNGHVIALDLNNGELLWDSTLAVARGRNEVERLVDVDAPLLATGRGIVASAYQQGTMLLTPLSGQIVWKRDFSSIGGAVFDGERLYFADLQGGLWSISMDRGATFWKQPTLDGHELSQPVIQADMIVIGDNEGHVHWFSKKDGSQRFSKRVQTKKEKFPIKSSTHEYNRSFVEKRAILASPLVIDEWTYLIDERGVLEAFRLSE